MLRCHGGGGAMGALAVPIRCRLQLQAAPLIFAELWRLGLAPSDLC